MEYKNLFLSTKISAYTQFFVNFILFCRFQTGWPGLYVINLIVGNLFWLNKIYKLCIPSYDPNINNNNETNGKIHLWYSIKLYWFSYLTMLSHNVNYCMFMDDGYEQEIHTQINRPMYLTHINSYIQSVLICVNGQVFVIFQLFESLFHLICLYTKGWA